MAFKKITIMILFLFGSILLLTIFMYACSGFILSKIGNSLVLNEKPAHSDAIVVLCVGVEYYPRLIQAAELFQEGFARKVVINGNRKTDAFRGLENRGFNRCCPWYENSLRILSILRVPRDRVDRISAEDAYDTVSEAKLVGQELIRQGFSRIIVSTSKYHTRRAHFIWTNMYKNELSICSVAAKTDPYNPGSWWKQGRQIRWVMAEYGAWVYYWWRNIREL